MIHSMTGYAALARELPSVSLSAEMKSVNGRYLDIQLRLPEELRALELPLREMIAARLARGKVECRVSLAPTGSVAPTMEVNRALLESLARAQAQVRAAIPDARPLAVAEVLHWPGVIAERDSSALREDCLALVAQLLDELAASRAREGEKLAAMIRERLERMAVLVEAIRPRLPEAIAAYEEKLAARLREALGSGNEERIRQEIALFGAKADVAEEISRLAAHLAEAQRVLDAGGAVGKRLEFLTQELNREANTLGAKSVSRELSEASLELKLLIEQIREQVQNIE